MAEREDEIIVEDEQDALEPEVEETDPEPESEQEEDDQEIDPDDTEPDEDEEEERVVVIGDESPEEDDQPETPGWVKKVRKVNRKLESENRRLRKELESRSTAAQPQAPPVQLGEKPTLKSVGYDDRKYESALASYYERKRQVEQHEAQRKTQIDEQQKAWQSRQQRYVEQKDAHAFRDYGDAEELVSNTLSIAQQGIIVHGAEDSALVVYALGKNPKKLEELSKVTDAVEFAFKVAKLESQLKVTNKKAPAPEKRVSGAKAGGVSGTEDQTLARLRKEAETSGDYTKVMQYKKKKRAK